MSGPAWVLIDGQLRRAAQARFRLGEDPLGGQALVESLLVVKGRIRHLREHLRRLVEGCRALAWPDRGLGELGLSLRRLASRSRVQRGSLRLRLWRDGRHLAFCAEARPQSGPLKLLTTAQRHFGPEPIWGQLKSNAMLPNLLAKAETLAWADDGLRLSPGGWVAEGVWSNLVLRKGRKVFTPPLHMGILEGVTRSLLLKGFRRRGYEVREEPLTRYDLYTADEVWLCSSIAGAVKVGEVDGRKVGL